MRIRSGYWVALFGLRVQSHLELNIPYTSNYTLPSGSSGLIIREENLFPPLSHPFQPSLHLNPSRISTFRITFNSKCTAHIYAALYAVRELCVVYTKPWAIKVWKPGDSKKRLYPEISVLINRRQRRNVQLSVGRNNASS